MAEMTQNLKPLVISELKPPMNITLVEDGAGLEKLSQCVSRILSQPVPMAGLDTETNYVNDFYFRKMRTIQFGDKDEQFVIDLLAFTGSEEQLCASQGLYGENMGTFYDPIFKVLDPVLCTNKVLKVGQNLAFEYMMLRWLFGRRIWHLYSTDMAERVIQAGAISLKKMAEFSMASIVARRFGLIVDKSEQKEFDLKTPLTQSQIEYAALDIRMPLAMRQAQLRVMTVDQLLTTAQIENDAIGSYTDMHLHGQNIDCPRWLARLQKVRERRVEEVKILDEAFIPFVGLKTEQINFTELERRENVWRNNFEEATPAEMEKALAVRMERDKDKKEVLKAELKVLKDARAELKAQARKHFSELSKERTKVQNMLPKCEGEAYINYGSNQQLLDVLKRLPGMKGIQGVDDDTLLKFNDRPLIQTLRKYKKGKKDTGTYGEQWTQQWITKPLKAEGWRHPWDGRIHCLFNQLEAETGRSSSSKPNAQNLPQDADVRACFICDPPDENIRISVCCNSDTTKHGDGVYVCSKCEKITLTQPEEYCIVTVDMAGAELCIIAELANATSWINAFAKGQDVHSVSTEILEPEKWPSLALPDCAYYAKGEDGEPKRVKCKCPGHVELRSKTKAINFLLCYGGGPNALADDLGITVDAAKDLMALHEKKFPDVWSYLERSGEAAKRNKESRDMYGRRRLFPPPTWESSKEWFKEENADRLLISEEDQERNLFNFKAAEMREPNEEEMYALTHRPPSVAEIKSAMRGLMGSIGRRGKNHCIQGTNASIIKRAMGCGFDKEGTPYLWHTLPNFKAKLLSMVHDELIVQCPKRFGENVAALVADAFRRAAAEVMTKVVMKADWHVANCWTK